MEAGRSILFRHSVISRIEKHHLLGGGGAPFVERKKFFLANFDQVPETIEVSQKFEKSDLTKLLT
jgi:hypothetical protein